VNGVSHLLPKQAKFPFAGWTHFTLALSMNETSQSVTFQLYLNGDLKGEVTDIFPSVPMFPAGTRMCFGYYKNKMRFYGHYDEIRGFNRTLTGDEIANMSFVSLPDDYPLFKDMVLYWAFDIVNATHIVNQPNFPNGITGYLVRVDTSNPLNVISYTASSLRLKSSHTSSFSSILRMPGNIPRTIPTGLTDPLLGMNISFPANLTLLPMYSNGSLGSFMPSQVFMSDDIKNIYISAKNTFIGPSTLVLTYFYIADGSFHSTLSVKFTLNNCPTGNAQPVDIYTSADGKKFLGLGFYDNINLIISPPDKLDGDYCTSYLTSITPPLGGVKQIPDGTTELGDIVDWEHHSPVYITNRAGFLMYDLHQNGIVSNTSVERIYINYILTDGMCNVTRSVYVNILPGVKLPTTFEKELDEGGSLDLSFEKIIPDIDYSSSSVRIVSLPENGQLHKKENDVIGDKIELEGWMKKVGLYAEKAVATSYLLMNDTLKYLLLNVTNGKVVSGSLTEREGETIPDIKFSPSRATGAPNAVTFGYGVRGAAWVASAPNQEDILEFCIEQEGDDRYSSLPWLDGWKCCQDYHIGRISWRMEDGLFWTL